MLMNCPEKVELVKEIIVKLAHYLDTDENHTFAAPWDPVPPERFLQKEQVLVGYLPRFERLTPTP